MQPVKQSSLLTYTSSALYGIKAIAKSVGITIGITAGLVGLTRGTFEISNFAINIFENHLGVYPWCGISTAVIGSSYTECTANQNKFYHNHPNHMFRLALATTTIFFLTCFVRSLFHTPEYTNSKPNTTSSLSPTPKPLPKKEFPNLLNEEGKISYSINAIRDYIHDIHPEAWYTSEIILAGDKNPILLADHGASIVSSSSFVKRQLISRMTYLYITVKTLTSFIFRCCMFPLNYALSLDETRSITRGKILLSLQSSLIAFLGIFSPKTAVERTIKFLWYINKEIAKDQLFTDEPRKCIGKDGNALLCLWKAVTLSLNDSFWERSIPRLNTLVEMENAKNGG